MTLSDEPQVHFLQFDAGKRWAVTQGSCQTQTVVVQAGPMGSFLPSCGLRYLAHSCCFSGLPGAVLEQSVLSLKPGCGWNIISPTSIIPVITQDEHTVSFR